MSHAPSRTTALKQELISVQGSAINMSKRGSGIRQRNPRSPQFLPPINRGDIHNSDKLWSRFHRSCTQKQSIYMDWTSLKTEKKSTGATPSCSKTSCIPAFKDVEEERVMAYLDDNQHILEHYVAERISTETLKKWLSKKMKQIPTSSSSSSNLDPIYQNKYEDKKLMFTELVKVLKAYPSEHTMLWELARYISSSVGVDAFRVYKLYPDHPSFVQYFVSDNKSSQSGSSKMLVRAKRELVDFVLEVAKSGRCRRLSRHEHQKWPDTPSCLFKTSKYNLVQADHVMYQPILTKNGKTAYVIEMWRMKDSFSDVDEEISSNFLVLASLSLHYCNMYLDKKRERNMSDFLLDVVKAIFEEMVSLDQLIKRILEFAQRLVNADRASLFLVDYRNFELVSTVFDLKFEPAHDRDLEKKEIRMPMNRGIAGHVALSGETMNIPDAYSDPRFNREVDEATGYKTVSILCMPIKVESSVIGVVQMVNKRDDSNFGHEDEAAFEIFSTFFGLALHHARLYDRIMRKEQKYRVALEVLSYHNTCRETEVTAMLNDQSPIDIDLNNYYLDPFKFDEFHKCKCAIEMFTDLFDLSNFDLTTLTRFVLTVKKNYRTVPYHNFDHGWTVAHTMYVILKNDRWRRFSYKMRLALFVACLCHDLDHRGYTNKYMSEIASPLAAMYTTSTLEHHHFNITVTILQQEGHNIFSHITSEDYKEILGFIRHCILATDLAKFFPNLEKINQLHIDETPQFDWNVHSHRDLAMAISMTAADLSASAKPWDIQIQTVKVIFEEFYDQGDKERAAGIVPIPMMDRNKPDEQPSSQVGFLSQICLPCYGILYEILPSTKPLYIMALKNLERWKSRANKIQKKLQKGRDNIEEDKLKTEQNSDVFEEATESINTIQAYGSNDLSEQKNIKENASEDTKIMPLNIKDKYFVKEVAKCVSQIIPEMKTGDNGIIKEVAERSGVIVSLNSETWEQDDCEQQNIGSKSGIWKNIDGLTWIDEEGLIVSKNASKTIINNERNFPII